jgi:hypothetical protein
VAFVALSGEAEYAYAWRSALSATLGFVRPKGAVSAVNENARLWINTVLEAGVGKLVNLGPRTTASRIACRVETYRDSAGVADDIGKNRLFLHAHAF